MMPAREQQEKAGAAFYDRNGRSAVRTIVLWLLIAVAVVIGLARYRAGSGNRVNVEPHAAEEIEKAKRR
jgi:hypothetical protein